MYVTRRSNEGEVQLIKVTQKRDGLLRGTDVHRNLLTFPENEVINEYEESSVFETVYQGVMVKC